MSRKLKEWQCRWSPTLGELESTHQKIWGTDEYKDDIRPTVFFGLYGLPDFYALWRHKGRKVILWAGTDIIHLKNGYWLEDGGGIRVSHKPISTWINKYCESYVENTTEFHELEKLGIQAKVAPSFLGDIDDFEVSYKWSDRPKVYASVSGDNFEQYGWPKVEKMAKENPSIEFHLYGNRKEWKSENPNVIVHGRVPKEQMNAEIKEMQGGLRLLEHDGFSEILAKSVLWGQWPISSIPYPFMLMPDNIGKLVEMKRKNIDGREYYRKHLNNYPFNANKKD